MASTASDFDQARSQESDTRFFVIMAITMSVIIVAGFVVNLMMGRSSFDAPWPYHFHGVIFMGWLGLYLAQHITISRGQRQLHVRLGRLAYIYIPLMVFAGAMIMIVVAQRTGGPFFFAMNEFLISNLALVFCFGGLAWAGLKVSRHIGWHRRLMLCSMAILAGPGLGRLLPAPLMLPYSWTVITVTTWIFPLIGMLADKRKHGRVHPAYWWGLGAYVVTWALSMVIAFSPLGYAFTEWVTAGTAGAERPMEAFLPPDFAI